MVPDPADSPERIQLHLVLPYKIEVRRDPQVQRWLSRGYRVEDTQRVTDRETLVTLTRRPWDEPT